MATEIEQYQRLCGKLFQALETYANPEFYHAISFMVDRPAGGFADDWGECDSVMYPNGKPGAHARKTLDECLDEFSDLVVTFEQG